MRFVRSVFGAQGVASFPSLRSQNLVTKAVRVVRPVGVLWIVGDLGAADRWLVYVEVRNYSPRRRGEVVLLLLCETHFGGCLLRLGVRKEVLGSPPKFWWSAPRVGPFWRDHSFPAARRQ